MKRIGLLMSVIAIVLFMIGTVSVGKPEATAAPTLADISGSWAGPQIRYLVNNGIISGYPDGTFRPNSNITRAEFITIVNRAFKISGTSAVFYDDVRPGNWYYPEVARAIAGGYLPDYSNDLLGPNQLINREEAAYMVAHAMDLDTAGYGGLTFKDASKISAWCRDSVLAMVEAGSIKGYPDGNFRPQNSITRAEASSIIYKTLNPYENPTGTEFNVRDFGAQGDGYNDDTSAFQKAIDAAYAAGGGTVYVPNGTYMIDPLTQVKLKSNTELSLSDHAYVTASSSSPNFTAVLMIHSVNNVRVTGGHIVGDRGSSWGLGADNKGIAILGSNRVTISGVGISAVRGDGIYVGAGWNDSQNYSGDINIQDFIIDNCSRQGISVISARNLTISGGEISNIGGSSPESGIDLEPNYGDELLRNILIENLVTRNCGNVGILVALTNYDYSPSNPLSITIKNFTNYNSGDGRAYFFWQYRPTATCKITVIE